MTNRSSNSHLYSSMPKEWVPCAACGGSEFEVLTHVDRYRMGLQTCLCKSCGLAMTNPMPSEESLNGFYRNDYRQFYRRSALPSADVLQRYGVGPRARYTAEYLQSQGLVGAGRRILDFGCAEGSLLKAIKDVSPEVACFGVEPNPQYSEFARRNVGMVTWPDLDSIPAEQGGFDLILVNHVLEHVRAPVGLLNRLMGLLSAQGVLYVDVPDAARYSSVDDLHIAHIYHFTRASLERVAANAGLEARKIELHEPPGHPRSIRTQFGRSVSAPRATASDAEVSQVKRQIERIERRSPMYFARRSLVGRALVGGPARIWRALVSRASQ